MRHVIVTRVTVLLVGLFLGAAGMFTWVTRSEPAGLRSVSSPALQGEALFDRHCSTCHAADDLRPGLSRLTDARTREIELFLADHGDASTGEDRMILDYLAAESPRSRD